jgi:hypothetical protein
MTLIIQTGIPVADLINPIIQTVAPVVDLMTLIIQTVTSCG